MKSSSSSQTYEVSQISEKCFEAVQSTNKNNSFTMCKINN